MSEMEPKAEEITKQSVINPNIVDCEQFNAELQKYYSGLSTKNKKTEWTNEKIQNVIKMIKEYNLAKTLGKRPSDKQYYHAKKYDIMNIGDEKVLILKRKSHSDSTVRIVPRTEFYERIHDAHIKTGHGRRDKIIYALKDKYVIPIWAINIFLKLCKTCLSKKSFPKRGIVVKPLISDDLDRRGQVDLVDFQSSPDKDYKWLLQYQDHLTKFCFLRPLKSKEAKEVAIEVLKIFLEVGCPNILLSDNGREFTAAVLKEIVSLWPSCKIVNGRPRYPQSQGSIERSNQDVKNMIRAWMVDNNSTNWSIGCYFAQFQKNSSYHSTIATTPFKALFGDDSRLGLSSTHLSKNIISKLETEEDIENWFNEDNKGNDNLQNSETHKADEQQKVTRTDSQNIIINQVVESSDSNMLLNMHKPPVTNEEVNNIVNSEINMPKTNDPENVPIITGNSEVIIIGQAISSILDTNDVRIVSEEIKTSNSKMNISETNEKGNVPVAIVEKPNIPICYICDQETSGKMSCQKCNSMIHTMCGVSNEDECFSGQLICNLCANENSISRERKESQQNLKRAAEKMTAVSSKKFKEIDIGTTVLVDVPKVDRGSLDSKNIIGKIVDKRNELYRVGTPFGVISDWIPRNAVLSSPNDISSGDIPQVTLPLRTIAAKGSSFGGQGIKQCNCKNKQCLTKRCNCKRAKVLCNSKCHKSMTCLNK